MTMQVVDVAGHKFELPDRYEQERKPHINRAEQAMVGKATLAIHPEDEPIVYFDSGMSPVEVRSRLEDSWSKYGMPPDSGVTMYDRDNLGSTVETVGTRMVRESLSRLGDLAVAS